MSQEAVTAVGPGRRRIRSGWAWFLVLLLGSAGQGTAADPGFHVRSAGVLLRDGVYYLDARIEYGFSEAALEALENGVPLVIQLDIEVLRRRWWWWNEVVAELGQRYRLQHHALSQRYVLTAINSGESRSFPALRPLFRALGQVEDLPLIDAQLLDDDESYQARLRARLDLDALPSPLRAVAYITPDWRLVSDWYQWRLDS